MPGFRQLLAKSRIFVAILALQTATGSVALAQTKVTPPEPAVIEEKPAPYDERLARLAEILGSVHYLRSLCKADETGDWRADMQQLLDAETKDEPKRREKLTAAFNPGYRSFASVHTDCTPAAAVAEERYRIEGATLASEIAARFGN